MIRQSLPATWNLFAEDAPETVFSAPVPGSVHDALLAAGALPDAHFVDNETRQMWVGDQTWIYSTAFQIDPEALKEDHIDLVCPGLDTFCEISINGKPVGHTNNMFRSWRFPAKALLHAGENTLTLRFLPASAKMARGTAERHLPAWNESAHDSNWGPIGRGYVRKQACQFGWDWGPQCPSAGPWQTVFFEAYSTARIADWHHTQTHRADGSVQLTVHLQPSAPADLRIHARLFLGDEEVAAIDEPFWGGWEWRPVIEKPALWWPNGMGAQPLYDLVLELQTPDGGTLDRIEKRIGLRSLELIREKDDWGRSFYFRVNGQRFFAKGANWIPLDAHPSARDLAPRYRRDLTSARDAHMNMLRVWGGGYFSHDVFYDLCDELGILVWQDLMFGCGTYPVWDERFCDSIWHETVDNARRLRHHACLACWCGNNELEMGFCETHWRAASADGKDAGKMAWSSYLELFERILPSALQRADPDHPYIPGSPHSSDEERRDSFSAKSGDLHFWDVWFSAAPFERYREMQHRFMSEFGFQSLPDARLLRRHAPPDEKLAAHSPWLAFRQRSQPGNARIEQATTDWFGPGASEDFDRYCQLTQITHGLGLKTGIEYWRTLFPQCGGATYWQLNDRWAAPTWASLDFEGGWKATHHFARRFFAPLLITGIGDPASGKLDVHVVNDHHSPFSGTARIQVFTTAGEIVFEESRAVSAPGESNATHIGKFALDEALGETWNPARCLVGLSLHAVGESTAVAENLVLFARPRALDLAAPDLNSTLVHGAKPGEIEWTVSCGTVPALWLIPHHRTIRFKSDDAYFPLAPNSKRTIRIRLEDPAQTDAFMADFSVSAAYPFTPS